MTIRLSVNNLTPSIDKVKKKLSQLSKDAYDVWYKNTPIRTGNARSKTQLRGNTIEARYPYAKRLDNGYSRQSPQGMVKPTEKFIKSEIRKILRNK